MRIGSELLSGQRERERERERNRQTGRQTNRQTGRRCVYAVGEKREREEIKLTGEIDIYKDEESTGGKRAYESNLYLCQ